MVDGGGTVSPAKMKDREKVGIACSLTKNGNNENSVSVESYKGGILLETSVSSLD